MDTRSVGNEAEGAVSHFLEKKGMTLLERNYVTPYGEADIIMKDGEQYVFIEVKARKSLKYGKPAEAITKKKKLRYLQIAQYFFMQNDINDYAVRFDAVEVYIAEKMYINHIQDAYDFTDIADYY